MDAQVKMEVILTLEWFTAHGCAIRSCTAFSREDCKRWKQRLLQRLLPTLDCTPTSDRFFLTTSHTSGGVSVSF